jgi:diguanylate cyclase (GGDEF)-like protein/PAS domain S-box-containing protein
MKDKKSSCSGDNLQENTGWLLHLFDQLPVMLFRCRCDPNPTITYVSKGCQPLTGYSQEMLINNRDISVREIIAPEYHEALYKCLELGRTDRKVLHCEFEIVTKTGTRKYIFALLKPAVDKKGAHAFEGFLHDITQRKQIEQENEYLGTHDFLSGLYNRRYFSASLAHLEQGKYPISCLIANINGLKLINKAYGYAAGDNLIKEAGQLLGKFIENGTVGACIGGDEFILIVPLANRGKIADIAAGISGELAKYKDPTIPAEKRLSMAIGYGTAHSVEEDFFTAYEDAEKMMRYMKLLDKNSDSSGILKSLLATLFEKSEETEGHCERLANLSSIIASRLGLPEYEMYKLRLYAMLHDIGKIGIDDRILKKNGSLTEDERNIMKTHPEIGYRIAMSWSNFEELAPYILSHHERWDGNGYPRGLRGKEIPLLARILAVADAYDAMTSARVYRKPIGKQEAMEEIRKNSSTQFDPAIVNIFLEYLEKNEP